MSKLVQWGKLVDDLDMIPEINEIEDQGPRGYCVGNGIASSREAIHARAGQFKDFSRLDLQRAILGLENRVGQDGAYPINGYRVMKDRGVCLESTRPYDLGDPDRPATAAENAEAALYKIGDYAVWSPDQGDVVLWLEHALMQGMFPSFTFSIYPDFMARAGSQRDWRWMNWVPTGAPISAHHVSMFGFSHQNIGMENSWTPAWGDGGFGGIPKTLCRTHGIITAAFAVTADTVPLIPAEEYYWTPRATILEAYRELWRYDITQVGIDHPDVIYWASQPGGLRSMYESYEINVASKLQQMRQRLAA